MSKLLDLYSHYLCLTKVYKSFTMIATSFQSTNLINLQSHYSIPYSCTLMNQYNYYYISYKQTMHLLLFTTLKVTLSSRSWRQCSLDLSIESRINHRSVFQVFNHCSTVSSVCINHSSQLISQASLNMKPTSNYMFICIISQTTEPSFFPHSIKYSVLQVNCKSIKSQQSLHNINPCIICDLIYYSLIVSQSIQSFTH